MEKKEIKLVPIKKELRPVLEKFLLYEPFQARFKEIAAGLGYKGDDIEKIKIALFTPDIDSMEICFADKSLYDMFAQFQIHESVLTDPNYRLIVKLIPEQLPILEQYLFNMVSGQEVDTDIPESIYEALDAKLESISEEEIKSLSL